ncbi:GGDEF domain-containing response regulator [Gloeothece verrucosa]|uniref:Response regulator receiver modulated diguanylate cyclase n=1 Tax=Gloeothece verrucosa (strain PCC 7822) TaxID=497965 RepID=E0U6I6_GLOV7|nr:PleD family two-component system response regulator [Gloeothece verrucosa]ADN13629.1 response regulator receiver modulated diguanylate cyclase [Gloeothece verrucosa PCC 7822]
MNNYCSIQTEPVSVLIVDDDPFTQMQLRLYLQRENYRLIITNNGKEGLKAYHQYHPDLVLLDAVMPEMDGFECCQQLMQLPGAEYTPILMITSLDDQQSVDQAFAVGATDYVTKPIHWPVLRQRVRRLLHQVRLQQQLEAANEKLQRLVSIDGLTQIHNRRRFDECIQFEWQRLAREEQWLALIFIDIDYFKLYNDTYGHQAGDHCLQQVAQTIQNTLQRPADFAARYGGEEFAVILPNTHLAGAKKVAEKIRFNIENLHIPHQKSSVSQWVSASLGVVCLIPDAQETPKQLIKKADQALYQAKLQGRNCLVTVDESQILAIIP